jgi:hypothetical protein
VLWDQVPRLLIPQFSANLPVRPTITRDPNRSFDPNLKFGPSNKKKWEEMGPIDRPDHHVAS